MPCTCEGYPEPEPDIHNGPAAELLCAVMQEHEARDEMSCFTIEQLAWWKEHKRRDIARVTQDLKAKRTTSERMRAIAKLTPYERKLLGVD